MRKQITKGTEAIKSATGVETMLLRAPYAAFDEQNWIDSMDLVSAVVSWNIDSGDWLLNGADEQVSTVLDSVTPGNIVLLTDSDECVEQTLEALPQIIDGLVADGYKIVTLSDLVKTDTAQQKAHLAHEGFTKRRVPQLPKDAQVVIGTCKTSHVGQSCENEDDDWGRSIFCRQFGTVLFCRSQRVSPTSFKNVPNGYVTDTSAFGMPAVCSA